jgi:hypothetical protein
MTKAKVLKVEGKGAYAMRQTCTHQIATLDNGHTLERLVWADCANEWGIDGTTGNARIGNNPLNAGDEVEYGV